MISRPKGMRRRRPGDVQPDRGLRHAAPRLSNSLSPVRQSQSATCLKREASSKHTVGGRSTEGQPGAARVGKPRRAGLASPLQGFDYDAMGEACGRAQRLCDVMSFGCLGVLTDHRENGVSPYTFVYITYIFLLLTAPYIYIPAWLTTTNSA